MNKTIFIQDLRQSQQLAPEKIKALEYLFSKPIPGNLDELMSYTLGFQRLLKEKHISFSQEDIQTITKLAKSQLSEAETKALQNALALFEKRKL